MRSADLPAVVTASTPLVPEGDGMQVDAFTATGRPASGRPAWLGDRGTGLSIAVGVCGAVGVMTLAVAASMLAVRNGESGSLPTLGPSAVLSALLGAVLIALRPRNPVGWCFFVTSGAFTVGLVAAQYAIAGLVTDPGSLPGAEFALWLQTWVYQPALIPFSVLMPLYFPDGRLPSSRWRPVVLAALLLMVITGVLSALRPGDTHLLDVPMDNPYGLTALSDLGPVGNFLPGVLWLSLMLASTTSLFVRFRRGNKVEREQIAWLAYAVALTAVAFVVDAIVAAFAPEIYPQVFVVVQVFPVVVPIAATVAILRYRLFDIDRLINRTLLYVVLTICVIGIYIAVVTGLGAVFDAVQGAPALSLLATGIVAVLFAPLRDRLQRLIDRWVYGDRADPFRALTMLGRRLESSLPPESVLPTVASTVADALHVPYTAVEVISRNEFGDIGFRTAAEHGAPRPEDAQPITVPLSYAGAQVGRLVLAGHHRTIDLSPSDRRVLRDLGSQIGIALHASQSELQAVRLAEDLQRSRERLVTAREEERRRIGRDLHDGLGPQLAGLTMTLEAARELVRTDPTHAEQLLAGLLEQADLAVDQVRRISHELRPPALDALGLIGALRSHAIGRHRVPVSVDAPAELSGLPAAVEAAAYLIALEALRNVDVHSGATACRLTLCVDEPPRPRTLRIRIDDDGLGIPGDAQLGVGLVSMRERAAELGGSCHLTPGRVGGTTVEAVLPLPNPAGG